jgi:hypothetical protein
MANSVKVSDISVLIKECDLAIRAGQGYRALQSLQRLCDQLSKTPQWHTEARSEMATIAQLARRAGGYWLAARLLYPVIREDRERIEPASDAEKAEYAIALLNLGAITEARQVLATADAAKYSPVSLYQNFVRFAAWDYDEAVNDLGVLFGKSDQSSYSHFVVGINFLSALIHTHRFAESDELFASLEPRLRADGHRLLLGNALELRTQSLLGRSKIHEAEKSLEAAQALLSLHQGFDRFHVDRLSLILRILREPKTPGLRLEIQRFQNQATKLKHFETNRLIDIHVVKAFSDEQLLSRLYWGTPFTGFRNIIARTLGVSCRPRPLFEYRHAAATKASGASRTEMQYDFATYRLRAMTDTRDNDVPLARNLDSVLRTLLSDHYRPQSIGSLFTSYQPDGVFNPFSAPNTVHQAIFRLRRRFAANDLPLKISNRLGGFVLETKTVLRISHDEGTPAVSKGTASLLEVVQKHISAPDFQVQDLSPHMDKSRSTIQRLLRNAVAEGILTRVGSGGATVYMVTRKTLSRG